MAGLEGPSRGGLLRGANLNADASAVKTPPRPTASVSTVQEVLVLLNWLITALDNRRRKTLAGVLNKEYGPDEAEADLAAPALICQSSVSTESGRACAALCSLLSAAE